MRRRFTAFSLIELTIVIGIIALLTTLLIMGVSRMARTGKTNATRADLENAQSFFDELNAHGGMNTAKPVVWLWRNLNSPPYTTQVIDPASPPTSTLPKIPDFWRLPNEVQFTAGGPYLSDALEADGPITDSDGTGAGVLRNGSRAVLNTQLAMRILLSYPGNKSAIAKLPADRLFIPNWVSGSLTGGVTGLDGIVGSTDDGGDSVTQVIYCVNNCVRYTDPATQKVATFRCIANHISTAASAPPNITYWILDTDPTPMLLDAWGNPLIFVPATGLINVYTGDKNTSTSTISILNGTPPANLSSIVPTIYAHTLPPVQSPDNRAFWMSAGPDGDLTTGDDNIYSFAK